MGVQGQFPLYYYGVVVVATAIHQVGVSSLVCVCVCVCGCLEGEGIGLTSLCGHHGYGVHPPIVVSSGRSSNVCPLDFAYCKSSPVMWPNNSDSFGELLQAG